MTIPTDIRVLLDPDPGYCVVVMLGKGGETICVARLSIAETETLATLLKASIAAQKALEDQ